MIEDLQRDLRELPPALEVSPDFYERVITHARRRRRAMRGAAAAAGATVVAVVIAVSMSLSGISSTARLVPVTPASPSAVTPAPSVTASPAPAPSASTPPSAQPTAIAPPAEAPATSQPAPVVNYAPLSYTTLPYPETCPAGYGAYGNAGTASEMCIPPGYVPKNTSDCPSGSHWSMGPVICGSDSQPFRIVAPISSPGLPSLVFANLPTPSCQSGYGKAGTFATVSGSLRCAPAAYLPRAGYTCPAGSEMARDPAPLCFMSGRKETIVAPVPAG